MALVMEAAGPDRPGTERAATLPADPTAAFAWLQQTVGGPVQLIRSQGQALIVDEEASYKTNAQVNVGATRLLQAWSGPTRTVTLLGTVVMLRGEELAMFDSPDEDDDEE